MKLYEAITIAAFTTIVALTIQSDIINKPEPVAPSPPPPSNIIIIVEINESEQEPEADPEEQESAPEEEKELQQIRCTCYLPTGNATASGVMPYEGICASNLEHMGWTARIYTLEGELIGDFLSLDTGGHPTLQNGTSIDIYRDNMNRAMEWINTYGDYVLIEWIEPEQ